MGTPLLLIGFFAFGRRHPFSQAHQFIYVCIVYSALRLCSPLKKNLDRCEVNERTIYNVSHVSDGL